MPKEPAIKPAKTAAVGRGELPRGEVAGVLNIPERSAQRVTSELLRQGVFVADSTRAPLRLAFPEALASRWVPGLFPDKPE